MGLVHTYQTRDRSTEAERKRAGSPAVEDHCPSKADLFTEQWNYRTTEDVQNSIWKSRRLRGRRSRQRCWVGAFARSGARSLSERWSSALNTPQYILARLLRTSNAKVNRVTRAPSSSFSAHFSSYFSVLFQIAPPQASLLAHAQRRRPRRVRRRRRQPRVSSWNRRRQPRQRPVPRRHRRVAAVRNSHAHPQPVRAPHVVEPLRQQLHDAVAVGVTP